MIMQQIFQAAMWCLQIKGMLDMKFFFDLLSRNISFRSAIRESHIFLYKPNLYKHFHHPKRTSSSMGGFTLIWFHGFRPHYPENISWKASAPCYFIETFWYHFARTSRRYVRYWVTWTIVWKWCEPFPIHRCRLLCVSDRRLKPQTSCW